MSPVTEQSVVSSRGTRGLYLSQNVVLGRAEKTNLSQMSEDNDPPVTGHESETEVTAS